MFGTKKDEVKEIIGEATAMIISDLNKLEKRVTDLENKFEKKNQKEKPKETVGVIRGFEKDQDFEKLMNICSDIADKDDTFQYDSNRESREIYFKGKDNDQLHKRGMWLIKKTGIEGLKYTLEKRNKM
jgi:hypothetical protein